MDAVVIFAVQQKVPLVYVPGHSTAVRHDLRVRRCSDEAAL
jgi:hypothetical protein